MQKHLFRGTLAGLLVVLNAPLAWGQDGLGAPILTRPAGSRPSQPVEPAESQPSDPAPAQPSAAQPSGSQPGSAQPSGSQPGSAQPSASSQPASGQAASQSSAATRPAASSPEDVLEATSAPPRESLNDALPTMMVPLPATSMPRYSSGQDAFDEGAIRKFEDEDKEGRGRRGRRGRRQSILSDDSTALESYRLLINRYVRENKFAEVEPYYKSYIQLLEKTRADRAQIAGALQRYSELLKKLGRIPESKAAEIKAHGLLTGEDIRDGYSLKEFHLGMSLDDFVRLPPPVSAQGPVKVVCSCDAGQKVEILTPEDEAAGLVLCGYWVNAGNLLSPHKMTIANIECVPDFRFIRDKGIYRLMEITTSFYSSYFPNMKTALQGKFGTPASNSVNKRRTETGNIFPETLIEWDNGISKIRLRNIDGLTFDKARLRFVHKPLHQIWSKAVQANQEQPKTNSIGDL